MEQNEYNARLAGRRSAAWDTNMTELQLVASGSSLDRPVTITLPINYYGTLQHEVANSGEALGRRTSTVLMSSKDQVRRALVGCASACYFVTTLVFVLGTHVGYSQPDPKIKAIFVDFFAVRWRNTVRSSPADIRIPWASGRSWLFSPRVLQSHEALSDHKRRPDRRTAGRIEYGPKRAFVALSTFRSWPSFVHKTIEPVTLTAILPVRTH